MSNNVKPIPDGYHTFTPYFAVQGATQAIEYYKKAFGATELFRMEAPGGKIGHAEMKIGNSIVMLADEFPEMDFKGPKSYGGSSCAFYLYVEDCDAVFNQAIAAGGKVIKPMQDQFYGDRSGQLEDPYGHRWSVATHKEDLSMEEVGKRAAEFMAKQKPQS